MSSQSLLHMDCHQAGTAAAAAAVVAAGPLGSCAAALSIDPRYHHAWQCRECWGQGLPSQAVSRHHQLRMATGRIRQGCCGCLPLQRKLASKPHGWGRAQQGLRVALGAATAAAAAAAVAVASAPAALCLRGSWDPAGSSSGCTCPAAAKDGAASSKPPECLHHQLLLSAAPLQGMEQLLWLAQSKTCIGQSRLPGVPLVPLWRA